MRSLGWNHTFVSIPWPDLRQRYEELTSRHAPFCPLLDIVSSIETAGCADQIAGTTSMHDLLVVTEPVPEPPMDVLIVRAPSSLHPPTAGLVRIEHTTISGRTDRIERPPEEAVALFWRFVLEKFSITSGR